MTHTKKFKVKIFNHVILLLLIVNVLNANNITITNLSLTGKDIAGKFMLVRFDLAVQNAWRMPAAGEPGRIHGSDSIHLRDIHDNSQPSDIQQCCSGKQDSYLQHRA